MEFETRMQHGLQVWFRAAIDGLLRFDRKNGWVMSSHVAMSMMLALFPFLLFVVALAGAMTSRISPGELTDLFLDSWPDAIAGPIENELRAVFTQNHAGLMTWGGLLTLYFASNGVDAMRTAMATAYRGHDPRPFWKQRLISLIFVLVGAALMMAMVIFTILLPVSAAFLSEKLPWLNTYRVSNTVLNLVLTAGVPILMVTAGHIWLPPQKRHITQVWPGVLITLVLWWLAGQGFSIYIARFASYSATYAGLAGAMSALIFLYLMSAILIYGAEFNAALAKARASQ